MENFPPAEADMGRRGQPNGQRSEVVYGRVHWEQLLQNMREAQFEEALRILSNQSSGPEVIGQHLPFPQ
jgi:hypothetical protein